MKTFLLTIFSVAFVFSFTLAQTEELIKLDTGTGELEGALLLPGNMEQGGLGALIIAGSGPTDRDGNSSFTQNNSLKLLASALADSGIASLRFDKRGVGKSMKAAPGEIDLLASKAENGEKLIVDGMNHILKEASIDRQQNMRTYTEPELGLHSDLMEPMIKFLQE